MENDLSTYENLRKDAVRYLERLMTDNVDISSLSLIIGLRPPLRLADGNDILVLSRQQRTVDEIRHDIDQAVRFVNLRLDHLQQTLGTDHDQETPATGKAEPRPHPAGP